MTGPAKNPKPRGVVLDVPAEYVEWYRERIAARTRADEATGCLIWTGPLTNGYGAIWFHGVGTKPHRINWILHRGPIPNADLVLDHLCRNRACVNPDHLELVSITENSARGNSWQTKADRPVVTTDRTACKNGHPWPEFAGLRTDHGKQRIFCLKCSRESGRQWYHKQRDLSPESGLTETRSPQGY